MNGICEQSMDLFVYENVWELTYDNPSELAQSNLKEWVLLHGANYQVDVLGLRQAGILHEGLVTLDQDCAILTARNRHGVVFPELEQLVPSITWPTDLAVLVRTKLLQEHFLASSSSDGPALAAAVKAVVSSSSKAVLVDHVYVSQPPDNLRSGGTLALHEEAVVQLSAEAVLSLERAADSTTPPSGALIRCKPDQLCIGLGCRVEKDEPRLADNSAWAGDAHRAWYSVDDCPLCSCAAPKWPPCRGGKCNVTVVPTWRRYTSCDFQLQLPLINWAGRGFQCDPRDREYLGFGTRLFTSLLRAPRTLLRGQGFQLPENTCPLQTRGAPWCFFAPVPCTVSTLVTTTAAALI
jgi:hypothetical protein